MSTNIINEQTHLATEALNRKGPPKILVNNIELLIIQVTNRNLM